MDLSWFMSVLAMMQCLFEIFKQKFFEYFGQPSIITDLIYVYFDQELKIFSPKSELFDPKSFKLS